MLGKLFSSLETIKIDTRLDNPVVQAGERLTGSVLFFGASQDKHINELMLQLKTMVEVEQGDNEYQQELVLAQLSLGKQFVVGAGEQVQLPFSLQLPYELPITKLACYLNKSKVWLHTHLDVDWGLDSRDKDFVEVVPTKAMADFLQAMSECGFTLHSADVEKGYLDGGYFRSQSGCYQELEFRATAWGSSINEVEVSFVPQHHQTHILLEIDRKGLFGGRDTYRTMTIDHQTYQPLALVAQIKQLLA